MTTAPSFRSPWAFWISAFGLAVLFDQLFWKKPNGISFLILSILAVAAIFILAAIERIRTSRRSYLLAAAILVLAVVTFVRREEFTRFLSMTSALGLTILLAITLRNGAWTSFRLVDHFIGYLTWLVAALSRPFDLIKATGHPNPENPKEIAASSPRRKIIPLLRGLAIALPLVFILGALFSTADPIFKKQMQTLLDFFKIENLGEYIFRLIYIVVLGYVFAGTLVHAIQPSKLQEEPNPYQPALSPFLGFTEGVVVLVCVNLLFLSFVIIQFRYLFGGPANITAAGFTYSEYARRGFFELVVVALLTLLLYLALATACKTDPPPRRLVFSALSMLLIVQVLIILASALKRLLLYENAYGFTRLRTYTHIFIPWLALLLATTIFLEFARRRGRFALALLVCSFGFVLTLGAINVDGLIVRMNVQRALSDEKLDFNYFIALSNDAVPETVKFFTNPALPESLHDKLGASLACRAAIDKEQAQVAVPWTAFHYSDLVARRLFAEQAASLETYQVKQVSKRIWRVQIKGITQNCPTAMFSD